METENRTYKNSQNVTKFEVVKWESDFKDKVSPLVKFDVQNNGYSMEFYNGESGIDAYWSGTIILKYDNYIKWNFSILNGIFLECKLNLDEETNKVIYNLYDFFKIWQAEVSKTITEPKNNIEKISQNIQELPKEPMLESLVINKRINKNRKNTIISSSERMKRLAGL